jgi:hypothetical protein
MGFQSNAGGALASAAPGNDVPHLGEDSDFAPDALEDLQIVRLHRANLLVVGDPAATGVVLELLGLSPREPVTTWRPRQPLELPPPGRATTLILHDVDQLTPAAQAAVLRWLDQSARQPWVVSTTTEPLWPHVDRGAFNEVLYYRLNTVCLHAPSATDE